MKAVDYQEIMKKRKSNYQVLKCFLDGKNLLDIKEKSSLFCYPLLLEQGSIIRQKLCSKKIYTPIYWKGIEGISDFEENIIENCIMLPIDQRYNNKDMEYIYKTIEELM